MRRNFKIIADDYGLGAQHNDVMCSLLQQQCLDGVSVMVSENFVKEEAQKLLNAIKNTNQEIGLHLNFSEKIEGISYIYPVKNLLHKALCNTLNASQIKQSILIQLDLFYKIFQRNPDFIDGHQHCHTFPVISDILINVLSEQSFFQNKIWIRSTSPTCLKSFFSSIYTGGIKSIVVMYFGAKLRQKLKRSGLKTNKDFLGFLPLNDPIKLEKKNWLSIQVCSKRFCNHGSSGKLI